MLSDQEKDFTYSRTKRIPYFEMKEEHYHPYHEIYYLCSGTRKFFINDTVYSVNGGDLVLIPCREIHKTTFFSKDEEHERIAITFTDHMINQIFPVIPKQKIYQCLSKHHIRVPGSKREYVEQLFEKMAGEYVNRDEYSRAMLSQTIAELLIFVMRQQEMKKTEDAEENSDRSMEEAAQFIGSQFHREISLEEISSRFHMSASYFSRKFKGVTGFGFKEYINALRLKEARALLAETDLPVTQIALKCGFDNSNYFGDVFKKAENMAPREYRKTMKSEVRKKP